MQRSAMILGEILLIALLYFVYTASDAPAINESHYLTKAKHYWSPEWCSRDLFLTSSDAHLTFYWSVGWLTKFFTLRESAWIARIVGWLFLAATWWRLSQLFVPRWGFGLLTAAMTVVLWDIADMAGEWVVGGIEGKVFAYGFVWLGLAALVLGRWSRVWIWFGLASAFHTLVGGWAVLAAGAVWCAEPPARRPTLASMLPALCVGGLLALFGLWPALAMEPTSDESLIRRSHHIYVFFRLAHHLVFHRMRPWRIAAHVALIAAWYWLYRQQTTDSRGARLHRFAAAAVAIAVCGIAWDLFSVVSPKRAASLLRFYWFRLSDVMVAVAATFAAATWWVQQRETHAQRARTALLATLVTVTVLIGFRWTVRHRDGRPLADARSLVMRPASLERAQAEYHSWRELCDWVRKFTPADALFLSPTKRQTFKWHAHRAELVTRKDIPQDAVSIAEWRGRMGIVGSLGLYRESLMPDESRLRSVTDHYDVDYVVLERRFGRPNWKLPIVYRNEHFVLYRCRSPNQAAQSTP
jgi:hypothetical protein